MKVWAHFKTITYHKLLVTAGCFRVGLYGQGLLHDLSKYTPEEFWVGCRYYQGTRSPNAAERDELGYSTAWLHHKGHNKHHYEYWIDVDVKTHRAAAGMKMPLRYVVEMFIDRIAASKVYQGKNYTDAAALAYYERTKHYAIMHEDTRALLVRLLQMLAEKGEEATFSYIRTELLVHPEWYENGGF